MAIKTKTTSGGKTAAGGAILNLALGLMKKDRTLTLEGAKDQVKDNIKSRREVDKKKSKLSEALDLGIGGKYKRAVLRGLLGHGIGDKVSGMIRSKSQDEKNAISLRDLDYVKDPNKEDPTGGYNTTDPKKERYGRIKNPNIKESQYNTIIKKLNKIESELKTIKLVKVPVPQKDDHKEKNPHHEDAALGLKALGYKKNEIEEMLKNANGATAQDLIKDALKPKNAEKIPVASVGGAVDLAKSGINNEEQQHAEDVKKEGVEAERYKKDQDEKKAMMKELDDIKAKVSHGGFLSALLAGLAALIVPILKFLKPFWTAFKLAWDVIKSISSVLGKFIRAIGNILSKIPGIAKAAGEFLTEAVETGAAELALGAGTVAVMGAATYDTASGNSAKRIVKATDAQANKYGLEIERGKDGFSNGNYKFNGTSVASKDLTDEEKTVIDASQQANPYLAKQAQAKIAANPNLYMNLGKKPQAAPMEEITVSSARIDAASTNNSDMKAASASSPTVIQNIDNSTKVSATPSSSGGGGGSIVIAVRNMESSVGNYIGTIFDHPVVRLPM